MLKCERCRQECEPSLLYDDRGGVDRVISNCCCSVVTNKLGDPANMEDMELEGYSFEIGSRYWDDIHSGWDEGV